MSTAAVNIAMTRTFAADVVRLPGVAKCPAKPKTYTYPNIREQLPDLPSKSAASISNSVESKYRKRRYETIWTGSASLPSARYPQPFPVPNQAWSASFETAGTYSGDPVPCVSVPLPGGRFLLQLRGGHEFARQLAAFRHLVSGEAVACELAILRQRVGGAGNPDGTPARDDGGQP